MTNKAILDKWIPSFPIDEGKRVNFSSILIAPRRSGKTFFIEWLITKGPLKNKYDMILIFTTSNGINEYSKFAPTKHIYSEFYSPMIDIIKEENSKAEKPINTLVIFDDSCSRKQKYNDSILDLYTKGRHFNISIIYSVQQGTLVDNAWKENSDFIFIFKQKAFKQKNYIVENIICGMLDVDNNIFNITNSKLEKEYYFSILKKVTSQKYHMLVVDLYKDNLNWFVVD